MRRTLATPKHGPLFLLFERGTTVVPLSKSHWKSARCRVTLGRCLSLSARVCGFQPQESRSMALSAGSLGTLSNAFAGLVICILSAQIELAIRDSNYWLCPELAIHLLGGCGGTVCVSMAFASFHLVTRNTFMNVRYAYIAPLLLPLPSERDAVTE